MDGEADRAERMVRLAADLAMHRGISMEDASAAVSAAMVSAEALMRMGDYYPRPRFWRLRRLLRLPFRSRDR